MLAGVTWKYVCHKATSDLEIGLFYRITGSAEVLLLSIVSKSNYEPC